MEEKTSTLLTIPLKIYRLKEQELLFISPLLPSLSTLRIISSRIAEPEREEEFIGVTTNQRGSLPTHLLTITHQNMGLTLRVILLEWWNLRKAKADSRGWIKKMR